MMSRPAGLPVNVCQSILACSVALAMAGCGSFPSFLSKPGGERRIERSTVISELALDRPLEERILALDPEHITDRDVRSTLSAGPTPRIILLHGSVYPAFLAMSSF